MELLEKLAQVWANSSTWQMVELQEDEGSCSWCTRWWHDFSGGWVEYGNPKHQEIFLSKKVKKWREFLLLSGFCCEIVWFDKMNNYKWSKFGLTKFVWWVHHQPQEIWTSVGLDLIPWAGIRWRWKSSKFWNQHWIYDLFGSNMGTYCRGSHGGGEGLMRWWWFNEVMMV